MNSFEIVLAADRPDVKEEAAAAFRERWPEFVFHDPVASRYLGRVRAYFGQYDILLLHDGRVAAGGYGVPIAWDGTPDGLPEGYNATLLASVEGHEAGDATNAFSFMGVVIARAYDKQGLATRVLQALIERARSAGLSRVIAPLRPTWKHRYPLVSMDGVGGHALPRLRRLRRARGPQPRRGRSR